MNTINNKIQKLDFFHNDNNCIMWSIVHADMKIKRKLNVKFMLILQWKINVQSCGLYDCLWQLCLGVICGILTLCKSQDVTLGQL